METQNEICANATWLKKKTCICSRWPQQVKQLPEMVDSPNWKIENPVGQIQLWISNYHAPARSWCIMFWKSIKLTTVYIYIYIVRGLTFARNPRNSMWDCNLLCFRAYFSHTATMQNIDIICVSLHFCACLRWCQNHLLKRILKISSVVCSGSSR